MPRDDDAIPRYLRRRAIVRRVVLTLLLLVLTSVLVNNVWQQARGGDDWSRLDRRAMVVQAVQSGGRIVVEDADGSRQTVVQLIGIDAFDVAPFGQRQPHWAVEAYHALRDRLQGRRVLLRLPPLDPRSPDGPVRAYVYLADGDAPPADSVNAELVAAGHAYADRRYVHPFHKQFEQAEGEARRKRVGQWKDLRDNMQPAWRQAWLRSLRARDEEQRSAGEAAAGATTQPATGPTTKPVRKRATSKK